MDGQPTDCNNVRIPIISILCTIIVYLWYIQYTVPAHMPAATLISCNWHDNTHFKVPAMQHMSPSDLSPFFSSTPALGIKHH
eukprot:6916529-Ditylum_brightwellii.AAC.1